MIIEMRTYTIKPGELQNFIKNIGIIAGLLILSAAHSGKYSIKN